MKLSRKLFQPVLALLLPISLVLASCGTAGTAPAGTQNTEAESTEAENADNAETESAGPETTEAESPVQETQESPADISERAMDNFLRKVEAGNYTINAEQHLKTSVYSNDLVSFEYADELYDDFAVMSVNNEAFQGFLSEDGVQDVTFIGEGQAAEAAKSRLLSWWMDDAVSQGNIYNLFYNSMEEPLTFVSYDDNVKLSLLQFAGYGSNAVRLMHEVHMIMDAEDPQVVHLTAVVDDDMVARIFIDDLDITVTFGDAQANAAAQAWMENPVYPGARSGWSDGDLFIFNSVFLQGYGEEAVPFPPFASYALTFDEENFVMEDMVRIRDPHATQENLQEYIELLKASGFSEVVETAENGTQRTYYRRLLREAYGCYSSIELTYDDGMNLTASKYYDCPSYDSLEAVNTEISRFGYAALPASPDLQSVKAKDSANEMAESWLYFFHYDLGLYTDLTFPDEEKAAAYMAAYEEELVKAGFHPVYVGDGELDRYESENAVCSVRYQIVDGTVNLLYKADKYITPKEAQERITAAGFPQIELREPITCRDLQEFEKAQYDQDYELFLTVTQKFADMQEAEAYLSSYEELLTAEGYGRVSPNEVGTLRQIAIYNEDTNHLVALDVFDEESGVMVNFEFRVR